MSMRAKRITKAMVLMLLLITSLVFSSKSVQAAEDVLFDNVAGEAAEQIIPHKVTTGDEDDLSKMSEYMIHIPSETRELIVPIVIDYKGVLNFKHGNEHEINTGYTLAFYSDAACTTEVKSMNYKGTANFEKAGTYYIKISIPNYTTISGEYYKILFQCNLTDGRNKTLKNKQWLYSSVLDTSIPMYYKVDISKTGIISLDIAGKYGSYVSLCNSEKKEISSQAYVFSDTSSNYSKVVFAVKKGTYYVKVKASNDAFRIRSTFTAVADASGASKKNAKTIKVGETKKGIVLSEDKTSKNDWFKFTLSKATKIDIELKGNCSSGKIRFELTSTGLSGSITSYITTTDYSKTLEAQTWTTKTIPKGTYYIRLYKDSKETSGNYSVKVKVRK